MSEEISEDMAAVLHTFGPETARALKRVGAVAKDLLVVAEVYGEAQRLQGVVAKLTREEQALKTSLAAMSDQYMVVVQKLEAVDGQLANNERLLDEARKGAQARIAAELDTWRDQQLTARKRELDVLMATRQEEVRAVTAALLVVQTEVKDTEAEQMRLQTAVRILQQTREDLVGEIAATA